MSLENFEKELQDSFEDSPVPNPGSPEAQEEGCECAVIDNHYGRGIPSESGPQFWINGNCPIHGK